MRRLFLFGAIAAATAMAGRAEDPKDEKKKDPFREFKVGEVKFECPDTRLEFSDFRIEQDLDGRYTTIKVNCKNIGKKRLDSVSFEIAFFDEDKCLLSVDGMTLGRGGFSGGIDARAVASGECSVKAEDAKKIKLWQLVLKVEPKEGK